MEPARPLSTASAPASGWPVTLALFATVFFARAWLIKTWGSATPLWDEWDAFALKLYRPWLEGSLTWADLFAAHNEHRIALTRLADLGLFTVSGGWNPWWQQLFNAALHALTAASLFRLFRPALTAGLSTALVGLLILLFTSTSGWQNALWGFQSHNYFCNLLSLLALAGLLLHPAFSLPWILGWFAAGLALFSTAGGALAGFAAGAVGIYALFFPAGPRAPQFFATQLAPLLGIALLGVFSWLLRVDIADHAWLHAHNPKIFFAAFLRCLSWPWIDQPWAGFLMQAPCLGLIGQHLRARRRPPPLDLLLLGCVGLAVLHAAAIALNRGASLPGGLPPSRYLDVQLFATTANAVILLRWATSSRPARLAGLAWSGLLLAGLLALTVENLSHDLLLRKAQGSAGLEQIRTYLSTHDPAALRPETKAFELHPDPATVQRALDDAILRPILPREFTDPAAVPPWPVRLAPWLTLLSLLATGLACRMAGRTEKSATPHPG